jgi:hypothetical protein
VLLCPPQTPYAARKRTRTTAVGSQWLTAWARHSPSYEVAFEHWNRGFKSHSMYVRFFCIWVFYFGGKWNLYFCFLCGGFLGYEMFF